MKLKAYINDLERLAEIYGDIDLVYAEDDEGNSFKRINFPATIGYYDEEENDFIPEDEYLQMIENDEISDNMELVICVNWLFLRIW